MRRGIRLTPSIAAKPPTPPVSHVEWPCAYRLIPSRFPPIDLFERVAAPEDWEALIALETLTNPRVRQNWGEISIVPEERRISGPGATYVMAPFTHLSPERSSRFTNGTAYGVYYTSRELETAIAETIHHMEIFYGATEDGPHREDIRELVGKVDARLHDIRENTAYASILIPDSYAASQPFARKLRDDGSDGIVFPSVRWAGGENIGVFWPDVVGVPKQAQHLQYEWNGERIARYFDYGSETWHELDR